MDKDLKDGQAPSNQEPAAAPAGEGEGAEEIDLATLPEPVQKRLKNAEGIISSLKEKAGVKSVKELEDKLVPKSKPAEAPKPQGQDEAGSRVVTHDELAAYQQGYSPEELSVAKSLKPGASIGDALKDPTVKAAINGIRSERQTNAQIPEPSSRIPVVGSKSFGDLKPPEKQANYGKTVETLIQKGRGGNGRNAGR